MSGRVVALSGGVGGAKLASGLAQHLGADLDVIVNTGDDFTHLGLRITPDIDTVLYTLSGLANRELGWGRRDESWAFMETLAALGGETWFRLGDRDLALHVARTQMLASGATLTEVTERLRQGFGITPRILPMTDAPVATMVLSQGRNLAFQRYFVAEQCAPEVSGLVFDGVESARPSAAVASALTDADLRAIVICPSNPYLSIDPILAVPGMRELILAAPVPVVAVSPLIAGRAVKGPTHKIMVELGLTPSNDSIAAHYRGLIDGLVIDTSDAGWTPPEGLAVVAEPSLMRDDADRARLAAAALQLAGSIEAGRNQ